MPICFVSNYAYLQHFYAALASFVKNNPGGHQFYLFNEDISEPDFSALMQWLRRKSPESVITDVKLDTSILPEFTGYWEKLGRQVFHRLLIPDELPDGYAHALYLDADIIFCKPFALPADAVENYTIAAIRDSISSILSPKRGLDKYFNAGIMLINITRWKANHSLKKLLAHQPKKTLFAEQELLNEVFAGDWYEMDFSLNYPFIQLKVGLSGYRMKNGEKPVNIHYLGGIKPWKYWVPGSLLYWNYVLQTPFWYRAFIIPKTMFKSVAHILLRSKN